jgi:hypothetical protein
MAIDGALHFGDDAVHHCQAQSSSLANTFGGEERFENSRQNFWWNAAAVVLHINSHKAFRQVTGLNVEFPFAVFTNGVACVDAQIDQHLLQSAALTTYQNAAGCIANDFKVDVDAF